MMAPLFMASGLVAGMNAHAVNEYMTRCAFPVVTEEAIVTRGLTEVKADKFGAGPQSESVSGRFFMDEAANIKFISGEIELWGAACTMLPIATGSGAPDEILLQDAIARISAALAEAGHLMSRPASETAHGVQLEAILVPHGTETASLIIVADKDGHIVQLFAFERTPETLLKKGGEEK